MKRIFEKILTKHNLIVVLGLMLIFCSIGGYALAQNSDVVSDIDPLSKLFNVKGNIENVNVYMSETGVTAEGNLGGASLHNAVNPIFVNGLRAGMDQTQVIDSSGNLVSTVTGTFTGTTITASGETVLEGLTSGAGALELATSTGTTILTEAQLLADSLLEITVNTGTTATIQLPATSTMATLMNGESKHRSWLIHNATSSTMAMTVTKGDGIDLIAVTTDNDIIDATEYAELECWRQVDTDVTCIISELLHAD